MGKIMRNGVQYGVDTADVLSTVAECDASASGGKGTIQVASAKALSELNSNFESSLSGVRFGIDAEGNYGYKKVGADTVIPFIRDINIGDKFNVSLTGSHNTTTTATVCYVYKTTVCLLGDTNLQTAAVSIARTWAWNYTVNIKNKDYTGTCRIPTLEQIYFKCAGYIRDFSYWTSTNYTPPYTWFVGNNGLVYYDGSGMLTGNTYFIEITL